MAVSMQHIPDVISSIKTLSPIISFIYRYNLLTLTGLIYEICMIDKNFHLSKCNICLIFGFDFTIRQKYLDRYFIYILILTNNSRKTFRLLCLAVVVQSMLLCDERLLLFLRNAYSVGSILPYRVHCFQSCHLLLRFVR